MKNKIRYQNIAIKTFEPDGTFEGYGSVFDIKDSYGDVVVKGAFQNSLIQKMPKLLWQHRSDQPIGVFTSAVEDAKGLHLTGQIALDTVLGKDAYALLKMGAIDGLSIGYMLDKYDYVPAEKTLYIKEVDLLEVSLVTFPANQAAMVEAVKGEFLSIELNKTVTDLLRRVSDLEESKMASRDGAEDVNQTAAETKNTDQTEPDADHGAKEEALSDALTKLLATFKAK